MSGTIEAMGTLGSLQRPTYNQTTGVLLGEWGSMPWDRIDLGVLAKTFRMGLVRLGTVEDLDGRFKAQRFAALISRKLAKGAGWGYEEPQSGDIVVADGQTLIVEHAFLRGAEDDRLYYCQCIG